MTSLLVVQETPSQGVVIYTLIFGSTFKGIKPDTVDKYRFGVAVPHTSFTLTSDEFFIATVNMLPNRFIRSVKVFNSFAY